MSALLTAAVHVLAKHTGHSDLVTYLEHPSQHSVAFIDDVKKHVTNIEGLASFISRHAAITQPGGESRAYSRDEVDKMVEAAIKRAVEASKEAHETTFNRSELDAAIAKGVEAALAAERAKQANKEGA